MKVANGKLAVFSFLLIFTGCNSGGSGGDPHHYTHTGEGANAITSHLYLALSEAMEQERTLAPMNNRGITSPFGNLWNQGNLFPGALSFKDWLGAQLTSGGLSDQMDREIKLMCLSGYFFNANELNENGIPLGNLSFQKRPITKEILSQASEYCGTSTEEFAGGRVSIASSVDTENNYPAYDNFFTLSVEVPPVVHDLYFSIGIKDSTTRFQIFRNTSLGHTMAVVTGNTNEKSGISAIEFQSFQESKSSAARFYVNYKNSHTYALGTYSEWKAPENVDLAQQASFIVAGITNSVDGDLSVSAKSSFFDGTGRESPTYMACISGGTGDPIAEDGTSCENVEGASLSVPMVGTAIDEVTAFNQPNELCAGFYNPNSYTNFDEASFFDDQFVCLKPPPSKKLRPMLRFP
jgi:hypothetical protein